MSLIDEYGECIHGLPEGTCTLCKPKDELSIELDLPRIAATAKYSGHCHGCDLPVVEGQIITGTPGGEWRHVDCW